jgi:2-polyprenyl-3-methyl-5-hydroxy-6-metoxy-1,4-benzoquinol methylase
MKKDQKARGMIHIESKKQDDYETIKAIIWNQKISKMILNKSKSIKTTLSTLKK